MYLYKLNLFVVENFGLKPPATKKRMPKAAAMVIQKMILHFRMAAAPLICVRNARAAAMAGFTPFIWQLQMVTAIPALLPAWCKSRMTRKTLPWMMDQSMKLQVVVYPSVSGITSLYRISKPCQKVMPCCPTIPIRSIRLLKLVMFCRKIQKWV
jgi:hypothetical protein